MNDSTTANCIDCIPRYARKRGTSYGICEQHFLEALTRAGAQMNATGGALSFATVPVVAPGAASVLAAAPVEQCCSRGFTDCDEDHEREPRCGDCGGAIRYVALAETWECRAAWCTWSSTNPIPEAA